MATSRNTQEPGRVPIGPEGGFQWTIDHRDTEIQRKTKSFLIGMQVQLTSVMNGHGGMTEVPCQSKNLSWFSLCLCGWRFLDKLLREQE
jgi:hypothetical protein